MTSILLKLTKKEHKAMRTDKRKLEAARDQSLTWEDYVLIKCVDKIV